ncbi:MAG: replication-relaxation family protein [Archaeoglobus sp.]|nr:replication-relaxation family protein [Archaeoglobus sp.]
MNARAKGSHRDKAILHAIERHISLDTNQVQCLLFKFKFGRRKAQQRLLRLYQKGKLNRLKLGDGPYCYYQDKKPGKLEHLLATNWVRIWLRTRLKSWERLHSWEYESDYKILRCDGFAAIKNTVTDAFKFYFVEMDRGTNEFDKVQKYNRLYDTEGYQGRWWVKVADRFPTVLVVATTRHRAEHISRLIEEHNKAGLRFEVYLLDQIKREVMGKCLKT